MTQDQLFAEVDKRANLAMSNEVEMLTFFLMDGQLYGLNVFKIIEILETPKEITAVPQAHPVIKGAFNFRGHPINLIDLGEYLGMKPVNYRQDLSYILVCEYSTTTQGFLVHRPNVLITKGWHEIIKPVGDVYEQSCLAAITYHEGQPIQMLDVEKILNDIVGIDITISRELIARGQQIVRKEHHILAVDDSKAACHLIQAVLNQMGIRHTVVDEAPKALEMLEKSLDKNGNSSYTMVFTDIEMPIMDGFTFTRKVKSDPRLAKIYVAVNSSLSNKSNEDKAHQIGADDFIPKFTPDNMARIVLEQVEKANRLLDSR
ncbi:chemotaxis protein [Candidatus Magnetaquicoccus inordinatus]|uniref:chemotaxis protein n=1 Tax=Candidatus Magnetaquicoccus inordinatus TaxID=2496818 RepID=UPI00102C9B77|nr:chemotaxis protein [Candidatus Magnetaquicoccus inordinatus]